MVEKQESMQKRVTVVSDEVDRFDVEVNRLSNLNYTMEHFSTMVDSYLNGYRGLTRFIAVMKLKDTPDQNLTNVIDIVKVPLGDYDPKLPETCTNYSPFIQQLKRQGYEILQVYSKEAQMVLRLKEVEQ